MFYSFYNCLVSDVQWCGLFLAHCVMLIKPRRHIHHAYHRYFTSEKH